MLKPRHQRSKLKVQNSLLENSQVVIRSSVSQEDRANSSTKQQQTVLTLAPKSGKQCRTAANFAWTTAKRCRTAETAPDSGNGTWTAADGAFSYYKCSYEAPTSKSLCDNGIVLNEMVLLLVTSLLLNPILIGLRECSRPPNRCAVKMVILQPFGSGPSLLPTVRPGRFIPPTKKHSDRGWKVYERGKNRTVKGDGEGVERLVYERGKNRAVKGDGEGAERLVYEGGQNRTVKGDGEGAERLQAVGAKRPHAMGA
ncbi:hypothetical protein LR48_Vigan11g131900 [Vigna angularis]|uniref:Uncharacterized protein n=1 Tax=Phaseolus angularis TaxID=3914 RepID=A0A0L9VT80_PHAAN|nr:hypothetical protein LR48_Vigan11g131900 [Vigna angularis]